MTEHYICTEVDSSHGGVPVNIAKVTPARPDHVERVLLAQKTAPKGDGASDWVWVRLHDGTLILGVFPQGETYELFSEGGVCNW